MRQSRDKNALKKAPRAPLDVPEGLARLALSPAQKEALKRAVPPAGQQEALRRLALPLKIKRLGLSFRSSADAEPPEPPNRQWRSRPPKAAVSAGMRAIDATYAPGARPRFSEIWEALKARLGPGVTRQQAREAIANDAPRLRGQRGYRAKT